MDINIKILLVLFCIATISAVIISRTSTSSQLSPDDPILTYRISDKNNTFWADAVMSQIEKGNLKNKAIAKGNCAVMSAAWGSKRDKRYQKQTFHDFEKRMKKQMSMIDAKLFTTPIVAQEYISYYFKINKSPTSQVLESLVFKIYYYAHADLNKIKQDDERVFRKKMQKDIKKHSLKTGLGWAESPYTQTRSGFDTYNHIKFTFLSEEKDFVRIDFTINKKGFLGFYDRPDLQHPPQYLLDIIDHRIKQEKKHFRKRRINTPYRYNRDGKTIDDIMLSIEEDARERFDYDINFIKAERRVTYRYLFIRSSRITDNENRKSLLLTYAASSIFTPNKEFTNIETTLDCELTIKAADPSQTLTFQKPHFIKHPWSKIKNCSAYKKWLRCHKIQRHATIFQCDKVPKKEPPLCIQ